MKALKLFLLPYLAAVVAAAFLWPEPAEGFIGQSSRIVFFHVPCAWTSTLAFLVAAAYSLAYLRRRNPWHDEIACAAVKLGLFFGILQRYRSVSSRVAVPPTWWLSPANLHRHLTEAEHRRIRPWYRMGGLGFVLCVAGGLAAIAGLLLGKW